MSMSMNQVEVNGLINACKRNDWGCGAVYLFHADLTPLQGLTETHLSMEEATLVYQCGDLLEALTYWIAL